MQWLGLVKKGNQHKLENVAAGSSEASDKPKKDSQSANTKFKVVSPKDKTSPQQVHEPKGA
jgi:hypothetical protein